MLQIKTSLSRQHALIMVYEHLNSLGTVQLEFNRLVVIWMPWNHCHGIIVSY